MNEGERQYWRKTIDNCEKFMAPKRRVWRRLLERYRMEFGSAIRGIPAEDLIRVSRFYPLTRQIITSIAFNNPKVFMRVEDNDYEYGIQILERVANSALEVQDAKREVRQAIFDALYCNLGWLKFGYNPPGADDIEAPYVMADSMANDFPYIRRVSPFNMLVDPLTPPHNLSHARFIIEKMMVPLEFVKRDERFVNRKQIRPIEPDKSDDGFMEDLQENPFGQAEELAAFEQAKQDGQMVMLYEIHDRIHQRRITFADGVEEPIEDVEHPFLEQEPVMLPDPMTGEPLFTGEYQKTGGFLLDGGFQYHAIKFDMTDDSFYGLPMMAYVEDEQNVIVDSVSRRADLLKRFPRLILGHRSERDENAQIADDISSAKDGIIAWVNDVNNSFRIMDQGQLPQDQLGIESDMRNYEEQILQVSQLALGGGPSRRTATEASLIASFGQLNREWLQDKVAEVYRVATYNNLRMMADPRYLPENFVINVGAEDGEPVYQAITSDMLKVRFKIEVEANSMRPMFEQLEREDMLALFNYLIQIPEVDRMESIKMLLRAFKVPNQEKLIGRSSDAPEVRTAQLENQFMASRMQDPGVLMEQDHQAHMRTHAQADKDPGVTTFLQQAMQMNPQALQLFQMLMQQHIQQHQQFMQRKAMGKTGKTMPSARDQAGMGDPNSQAKQLQNVVKSNAQRTSQTVGINTEQN